MVALCSFIGLLGLFAASAGAEGVALAQREVLPGGTVLLVAERPAIPVVVVSVYVRAGSAYDPPDEAGLANLTAAVLTRGTRRRSGPELDRAIEFVGGSLEAVAGRDGATVSLSVLGRTSRSGSTSSPRCSPQPDLPGRPRCGAGSPTSRPGSGEPSRTRRRWRAGSSRACSTRGTPTRIR